MSVKTQSSNTAASAKVMVHGVATAALLWWCDKNGFLPFRSAFSKPIIHQIPKERYKVSDWPFPTMTR